MEENSGSSLQWRTAGLSVRCHFFVSVESVLRVCSVLRFVSARDKPGIKFVQIYLDPGAEVMYGGQEGSWIRKQQVLCMTSSARHPQPHITYSRQVCGRRNWS